MKASKPEDVIQHATDWIYGRFTLRWRSPPVMNSRGLLKFDWPRATLLSGGDLHYGQESFGGEHCKLHGCQGNGHFLEESSPEVKFLGQPQSLRGET